MFNRELQLKLTKPEKETVTTSFTAPKDTLYDYELVARNIVKEVAKGVGACILLNGLTKVAVALASK